MSSAKPGLSPASRSLTARLMDHPLVKRMSAVYHALQILRHPLRASRRRALSLPVDEHSVLSLVSRDTPEQQIAFRTDIHLTTHTARRPASLRARLLPVGLELDLCHGLLTLDRRRASRWAGLLTVAFDQLRIGLGEHPLAALARGTLRSRIEMPTLSADANADVLLQCPAFQGSLKESLRAGRALHDAFQRDGLTAFLLSDLPDLQLDLWLTAIHCHGPASFLNMSAQFIASRIQHVHLVARTEGENLCVRGTAEVDLPVSAWVLKTALSLSRHSTPLAVLASVEVEATPQDTLYMTLPETVFAKSTLLPQAPDSHSRPSG